MARREIKVLSEPPRDEHIAACGLFCTNCGAFKRNRCPGCQVGPRFHSCPVRVCVAGKGITTCADCPDFRAPRNFKECPTLNSFIARVFSVLFRSDRPGALALLRDQGRTAYLAAKRQSGKM